MDEFNLQLSGELDQPQSESNINKDIEALQKKIEHLKIQADIDPKVIAKLTTELENLLNKKISISNLSVNQGQITKTGQQIGNTISNEISKSTSKATGKIVRDFSQLNEFKRQFVEGHGIISKEDIADVDKFYSTIRQAFSEFGQVTISKGEMNDGDLENLKVKIQQVNGELKTTREFMLYLNKENSLGNTFKLADDDVIKTAERMVQHLDEAKNLTNATADEANAIKEVNSLLSQQEKAYEEIWKINKKIASLEPNKDIEEISALNQKKKIQEDIIIDAEKSLKAYNSIVPIEETLINFAKIRNKAESDIAVTIGKQQDAVREQVNKIQHLRDEGKFTKQIADVTFSYNTLSHVTDELKKDFETLTNLGKTLNTSADADELRQSYEQFNTTLQKVKNSISTMDKQGLTFADSKKITSLTEDVLKFTQNNTNMSRNFKNDFDGILDKLQGDAKLTKKEIVELEREIKKLKLAVRDADQMGFSFVDKMKNAFMKFSEWGFATGLVTELGQGIKRVFDASVKLDGVVTDLTMATDLNEKQIDSLTESYSKLGDNINATLTDVIESGTEWIKQGESIANTETLITNAMILSKIAKLSSADSTKYLTSAMKGYKVAANDTLDVVDKLSAVDMASATSVSGLAEGMSQVANNANIAGISMDKLLGYLAVIGETTQSSMSEVGTSLNAIFSRMGNIKLARLKDYQNNGEDLSNVETVLRGEGIILRETSGEFRNFGEVLDEVAGRWTSFSEVSQRAIASAFAGTNHMENFLVLMEGYGTALEYTEASIDSSGKAMQKFSEYQDSVTAHTDLFEKAIEDLANTAIDSGLVTWFIDLGTTGVKAIDGLVDGLKELTSLGGLLDGNLGGTLGALSGLAMNKLGVGERTMFQW